NPTVACVGPPDRLRQVVDARDAGGGGLPQQLKPLIESIPADHAIWAAFTGGLRGVDLGMAPNSNLQNVGRIFQGIDSATLALNLNSGIALSGRANCKTDEDARRVHDALRGIIGIGRLSTPSNRPEMLAMYDAIHVDKQQARVDVSAQISQPLVDHFLDVWV